MKLSCSLLLLISLIIPQLTLAGEKDVYEFSWLDPDKEVYVLQNRKFRKANHLHVNVGYGLTTSGAFVDSSAIQARGGYFFTEDWGFEVLYSKNSGEENDTFKSVVATVGGSGTTPFRRIVQNYYGVMGLWSPFYTKINTFNKIAYMDWIFGLGYGQLTEQNNKTRFDNQGTINDNQITEESHSGILWTAAMKFYLDQTWSIRADFTGMYYSATEPKLNKSSMVTHYDATLSLGFGF